MSCIERRYIFLLFRLLILIKSMFQKISLFIKYSYKKVLQIIGIIKYPDIITKVKRESLTYLGNDALLDLYKQVYRIEKDNINGIFIEAGCALGGSAMVIAVPKSKNRHFNIYDVFDMIPPPSEKDGNDVQKRYDDIIGGSSKGINGKEYYGYQDNLYEKVIDTFYKYNIPIKENNINLIKGLFQDTINIKEDVSLAHIDGDWYESVLTCLESIEPHLVIGGVLIIDDYYCWSGCKKAVDEYFADKKSKFLFKKHERLHIIRKSK